MYSVPPTVDECGDGGRKNIRRNHGQYKGLVQTIKPIIPMEAKG